MKKTKALTQNQIELLPKVKERNEKKKTKKSLELAKLIERYLAGNTLMSLEISMVKIAVQLYQAELKGERLKREKAAYEAKQRSQENKDLTREKIILGACEVVALQNNGAPFLNFLLAWRCGYVSEKDLDFFKTRHKLSQTKDREGYKKWEIQTKEITVALMDKYNPQYQQYVLMYEIIEIQSGKTIKSFYAKSYNQDPRLTYGDQ